MTRKVNGMGLTWEGRRGTFLVATLLLLLLAGTSRADPATVYGQWEISGRDSVGGDYEGTVTLERRWFGRVRVTATVRYDDGRERSFACTGRKRGNAVTFGYNYDLVGITGRLDGANGGHVRIEGRWTASAALDVLEGDWAATDRSISGHDVLIRPDADDGGETPPTPGPVTGVDLRIDSNNNGQINDADDAVEDREARTVALNDDDDGAPAGPDNRNDVIDTDADRLDLARAEIRTSFAAGVRVELSAQPAGVVRLFSASGTMLLAPTATSATLDAAALGSSFLVEGVGAGDATITLTTVGGVRLSDSVRVRVTGERVYLFLWGYQGTEETYLPHDVETMYEVIRHLQSLGYTVYDDTQSFDQSRLDAAFTAENLRAHPHIVINDRCVTRQDIEKYFARGTIRGFFWGSHGFMEPWIGCPDNELLRLESRVWSSAQGSPASNDVRNFVREWQGWLSRQSGALDFVIMHSCATGGLGADYSHEPWEYTHPDTKARVERLHGRLPPTEELTFRTFNELQPLVGYLQTFNGSAYFGLHDVSMSRIIRSIRDPGRG